MFIIEINTPLNISIWFVVNAGKWLILIVLLNEMIKKVKRDQRFHVTKAEVFS